ncbi:lysine-2,3-aminomutase-like protein [Elioraea thermophila]|uniref:lysine-2,3-aminomutase-like protein n=1 Tax=Elioraea thermophila TaxID=2185104 RepID=UPI000DF490F0|nr:lysine-2,3-aminomutase-like protein [Elioraea thermophila]
MFDGPPPARTLRDIPALAAAGLVARQDAAALAAVADRYAVAVTPNVAALIDPTDAADPIAAQYVPHVEELVTLPDEAADPTGDGPHGPVRGVVHRYPDRALLLPTLACAVYCRFCFRRDRVGPDGGTLTEAELDAALAYIAATPAIREVILTGGDPLILSARRVAHILRRLAGMPHVETVRVHSRVPVADPARITDERVAALADGPPLWLLVHVNHARELSASALAALDRLRARGIPLLAQTVLLRGVNDSTEALEALFRALIRARVKPHYLHLLDPAPGTARFRVPLARARALHASLRGRLPGHAIPALVLDIPGGAGKVEANAPRLLPTPDGGFVAIDPSGAPHALPPGVAAAAESG